MAYSYLINALPFWILGVPLAVAVISYMRLPRQNDLVERGRASARQPIHRDPAERSSHHAAAAKG